jgi:hypothetical protein
MIPIMIIEPTATTTEQIAGQSEHSDNGCPPAKISLHMRKAPPRQTHSETSFGPQQGCLTLSTRSARRATPWIKVKKAGSRPSRSERLSGAPIAREHPGVP